MLDWAITHQSDPFPCPYSTGPQWIRLLREALAKDPSSTSPRAVVDIEGADTVDGEVATEQTVPVPKRITVASSGTSSSCFLSNGCSFKTWEAVNTGPSFFLQLNRSLLLLSC